jgi:hypothetical protein
MLASIFTCSNRIPQLGFLFIKKMGFIFSGFFLNLKKKNPISISYLQKLLNLQSLLKTICFPTDMQRNK